MFTMTVFTIKDDKQTAIIETYPDVFGDITFYVETKKKTVQKIEGKQVFSKSRMDTLS